MKLMEALEIAKKKYGYTNLPDPRDIVWTNEMKAARKRLKKRTDPTTCEKAQRMMRYGT